VKYKDPKTGKLMEQSGRQDAEPVVIFPEGYNINTIRGATAGSNGNVRLKYKAKDKSKWIQLGWRAVNPQRAFAYQFELSVINK
jgi:hypothetical protein